MYSKKYIRNLEKTLAFSKDILYNHKRCDLDSVEA